MPGAYVEVLDDYPRTCFTELIAPFRKAGTVGSSTELQDGWLVDEDHWKTKRSRTFYHCCIIDARKMEDDQSGVGI